MTLLTVLLVLGNLAGAPAGGAHRQVATQQLAFSGDAQRSDSLVIRKIVEDSTRSFLRLWQKAWIGDRNAPRRALTPEATQARLAFAHCHMPVPPIDEYASKIKKHYAPIKSEAGAFAVCPSWPLARTTIGFDEAVTPDSAVPAARRELVSEARKRLLALLDSAQKLLPGDSWILGQRIRFSVDNGDNGRALRAARGCIRPQWWCAALSGFVLYNMNAVALADSAFSAVAPALGTRERCDWNDVRSLLSEEGRNAYAVSNCAVRDSLSSRYWWLSRPLFQERVNERQVAHYARRISVMLHAALEEDERYHWLHDFGGDAVEEMIMRFGWPTVTWPLGKTEDISHNSYLAAVRTPPASPYSTAEYAPGRVHFAPEWITVIDPFNAPESAWTLNAPESQRTGMRGSGDFWWPFEHVRYSAQAVVQYPEGQTAVVRRQHNVEIATAIDVESDDAQVFASLLNDTVSTSQFASPSPDSIELLSRTSPQSLNRVLMHGVLVPRPVVISIESVGKRPHGVIARTRFGVIPPTALVAEPAGAVSVSEPVFFTLANSAALPSSFEAMLPLMLGSTSIPKGGKVGIFWENYGITARDSVRFGVTATSTTQRGFFKRLASLLKLADAAPGNMAVSWRDQHSALAANPATGVPVSSRSIVLDLSQLPKGTFSIEVVLTAPGHEPARAHRSLTIR